MLNQLSYSRLRSAPGIVAISMPSPDTRFTAYFRENVTGRACYSGGAGNRKIGEALDGQVDAMPDGKSGVP